MPRDLKRQNVAGPAVWQLDVTTGATQFSARLAALLGTLLEQPASDADPLARWLVPEEAPRHAAAIAMLLSSTDAQCHGEVTLRCADGRSRVMRETLLLVRDGANPRVLLGALRSDDTEDATDDDVTMRMEHSQLLFKTFVDALPQLAWTADAEGWLHFYNRRWYEYTGKTPAEMEGWGWISVHDAADLPRMLRIWRNALETGEPWEDEFRLRRGSDGMLRWHLSRAMPVRDASGRIIRWFGTNTDVHDQKLAAEEYARLLAREEHARREAEAANRAKDEFLAVVSHELRTPLNAILGWAQVLARTTPPPEQVSRGLAKIEENARRQAKLIEDLLDVSRLTTGKLTLEAEPVVFGDIVQSVVDSTRPLADEKKVLLVYSDASAGAQVHGSASRLGQIVGNLLSNAVKFTPPGGQVTVTVSADGKVAGLRVADTGQGIAPEFLPHVFDRFRQADPSSTRAHAGLGLGLAIVRELVHAHGGEVGAESPGKGQGATFTVRLPVFTEDRAAVIQHPDRTPSEPVALTGIKVLAVDDEASAREVLAETLLGCGASVTVAGSVHEALRAFKLGAPDIIVTDIAMPEQDGYVLVDKIRSLPGKLGTTPIVALTAYASLQDRERALRQGFDRYLAKPLDAARLSAVVAELVRGRVLEGSGS